MHLHGDDSDEGDATASGVFWIPAGGLMDFFAFDHAAVLQ